MYFMQDEIDVQQGVLILPLWKKHIGKTKGFNCLLLRQERQAPMGLRFLLKQVLLHCWQVR